MNSGKCSLPKRHWIWKRNISGLIHKKLHEVKNQCFKGDDEGNQCLDPHVLDKACTWHHFYPNATRSDMMNVYLKIAQRRQFELRIKGFIDQKEVLT
jgi:hypothetical protein